MANVFDVAEYILKKMGPMTTMKLQKLVYYSQAWNIAWTDDVLFPECIEAWADGPVVPELWKKHRGAFRVSTVRGNDQALSQGEKETVDKVLEFYGGRSPQWLSDLTHMEDPWLNARRGTMPGDRCTNEISPKALLDYYSNL
jgi:uncharacterized phage-associated protein